MIIKYESLKLAGDLVKVWFWLCLWSHGEAM